MLWVWPLLASASTSLLGFLSIPFWVVTQLSKKHFIILSSRRFCSLCYFSMAALSAMVAPFNIPAGWNDRQPTGLFVLGVDLVLIMGGLLFINRLGIIFL